MSTVHHGALDYAEIAALGLEPEALVDFSSNCNPYGPPPGVIEALRALPAAALARYPDRACLALRAELARLHEMDPDWLLVGNGSAELIWGLARALLQPGARALVLGPTFGEYAAASRACHAEVGEPFWFDINKGWCPPDGEREASLLWLCNPNNPTGHLLHAEELAGLREHFPAAYLIVDEAYLPFVRGGVPVTPDRRVIVLRSLTKDFGMAGLRLGYLMAPPAVVERVRALLPPWQVGAPAQAAGLAALGALAWRDESLARLDRESERLQGALRAQGWRLHTGATPFFLLHVEDGATLRRALLSEGLVVRDCASFGLREWVRIAPQRPAENDRLVEALERYKNRRG